MKISGTGCVVNVWIGTKSWGLGLLYWPCDTHPNLNTCPHLLLLFPPLLFLYWQPHKINKNDLGVHPPFGRIILEVPSLGYSSHTVQWASRAHVICHWFPPLLPPSLPLPDSLAPSHCTQHKKLTSSYTLLMHMHNDPLFSCPLVISLSLYLSGSLFLFLLYLLRAPDPFLKSLHRSLFTAVMDDLQMLFVPNLFYFSVSVPVFFL